MRPTTSNEIRQSFLDFFSEVGHEMVASAPLPLYDNPTLLFTNAGMNQFTDVFLGKEKRPYARATSVQKCMRVQGKHNDLENVGPSPRHHTFFEMLGNFSFGNYFKKEAIDFAWTYITEVLEFEPERLWVTVYSDDDESFELWQRYMPAEKILRFGKKDNFWEMGEVGPCGPNSEIFYYVGDMATCDPSRLNADDDEAFLEFWNLVFMQFNREEDGSLTPLPKPSVDTGMGFERVTRIIQKAASNYETDLFTAAMERVQTLLAQSDGEREEHIIGYRVIADHGRAATFMIADGVMPGNVGAAYVLRMVIRRAARFGRKIGFVEPFLAEVAQVYIDLMGDAYPELQARREHILHTVTEEEKKFARTLDRAMIYLDNLLNTLHQEGKHVIPGKEAFNLHATHGLPLEITRDLAQERHFEVDEAGFLAAQTAHAEASGAGAFKGYETGTSFYGDVLADLINNGRLPPTGIEYDPYSGASLGSEVLALIGDEALIDVATTGESVQVVTAATPFYVESGGEVSDTGRIVVEGTGGEVQILDTIRPKSAAGLVLHVGQVVRGEIKEGQWVQLEVDDARRADIRRNHTATHLLHRALRDHLGKHVTQQGSLVAPDRLRFDFSHGSGVDQAMLTRIETAVNEAILTNYPVGVEFMAQDEAIDRGAIALFGEKYGDIVRTIQIGEGSRSASLYSFELCGGLHVQETSEIGLFRFVSEGAVAAGVRRVEAVTGNGALAFITERLNLLDRVAHTLNAPIGELENRLETLLADNRTLQKQLEVAQRRLARGEFEALLTKVQTVAGVNLLTAQIDGVEVDTLREMADWFRDKMGSGTAVLATVKNGKPLIIATVTDDLIKRGLKAGDLVREVAKMVGGGGGGRPNMAQAGGKDPDKLPEALTAVSRMIEAKLK